MHDRGPAVVRRGIGTAAAAVLALGVMAGGVAAAPPGGATRAVAARAKPAAAAPADPMDPLSRAELRRAMAIVEADARFVPGSFFPLVTLQEPPKAEVLAWTPGAPFSRRAFLEVYDRPANLLTDAVVDLEAGAVESWTPRPGDQPPVYLTEWTRADEIVRADPRWQAAIAARGLDPKDVYSDIWAPGDTTDVANPQGHRVLRALVFFSGGGPHPYSRPVEGIVSVIDMTDERVLSVTDTGPVPVATDEPGSAASTRPAPPALIPTAPRRSAVTLHGRDLTWQGWHLHLGYAPREGLVLDRVGFEQDGVVRPVIYRMSLSEIYVPYGDPDPAWRWRTAFDVGEYAVGQYAVPLKVGVDVPPGARFLDATIASDTGTAGGTWQAPHAVAIWERPSGTLWSRTDPATLEREAVPGRQLVITNEVAIGNYSYQVEYVFDQGGAIDVVVHAQGTVLTKGLADGVTPSSVPHLTPIVGGPDHQHFIAFRIDFDVDGTANDVITDRVVHTPAGTPNQFGISSTTLATEQSADPDAAGGVSWRIVSATARNAVGQPTGYRLVPTDWTVPYSTPEFSGLQRAPFAAHPVWFSRYDPAQRYAGGDHPLSGQDGDGVAAYVKPPEPLSGQDVVAWYTLGLTHHPETEDYPAMNGHTLSFRITPAGFFDRNPAIDVPAK